MSPNCRKCWITVHIKYQSYSLRNLRNPSLTSANQQIQRHGINRLDTYSRSFIFWITEEAQDLCCSLYIRIHWSSGHVSLASLCLQGLAWKGMTDTALIYSSYSDSMRKTVKEQSVISSVISYLEKARVILQNF